MKVRDTIEIFLAIITVLCGAIVGITLGTICRISEIERAIEGIELDILQIKGDKLMASSREERDAATKFAVLIELKKEIRGIKDALKEGKE